MQHQAADYAWAHGTPTVTRTTAPRYTPSQTGTVKGADSDPNLSLPNTQPHPHPSNGSGDHDGPVTGTEKTATVVPPTRAPHEADYYRDTRRELERGDKKRIYCCTPVSKPPTWQGAPAPEDDLGNRICGKTSAHDHAGPPERQYTPSSQWDTTRRTTRPARQPPLDTQCGPDYVLYIYCTLFYLYLQNIGIEAVAPLILFYDSDQLTINA